MRGNKLQVAGLVSAAGSTAAAVCLATQDGRLDAEMPIVIANHPKAGEKLLALRYPPKIVVISRKAYESAEAFGEAILAELEKYGIGFIGLWGWDPKVPDNILRRFERRITNQHPDLTPWFGGTGMNGIVPVCARLNFALAVNRKMHVEPISHWATNVIDGGAVVKQGWVEFWSDDTCESLYDRVKVEEHKVQIATVADAAAGRLRELEVLSPIRPGEESILAAAKAKALAHHANATQSALKSTKR